MPHCVELAVDSKFVWCQTQFSTPAIDVLEEPAPLSRAILAFTCTEARHAHHAAFSPTRPRQRNALSRPTDVLHATCGHVEL